MCCETTGALSLPAEAIEALARYRRLLDERGWDWGDDRIDFWRWERFSVLGPVIDEFMAGGDWPNAIRSVIGDRVPAGVVMVRVDPDGRARADLGPPRTVISGRPARIDVVVDSESDEELPVSVAGQPLLVPPRGAAVATVQLESAEPAFRVELGGRRLVVEGAIETAATAVLRLSSPRCSRWSVTDPSGGAWFPEGALAKWDAHNRPFFHGHDLTLSVPASPLEVVCARGLEFDRTTVEVRLEAGETRTVECDSERLFDPAADGWYGGDLHIHMNYGGDLVCAPDDAARMQLGEGLHLANLVAGNCTTSLVYDREMLEGFAGVDLPWSRDGMVARMGVEYRNDLLGHVHALGPDAPPASYQAGHERSDHREDWPPNKVACEQLRALDATVGYCHPALTDFPDGSTRQFFENPRSVEARELVADAALGVVDSIDLISPFNDQGAVFLYHRLLSCGLRLAATAGTDVFLSFSHLGTASNPPGWGRVYAHLGDQPLSAQAFKEAIRQGRTVVTNGPWLSLEVNGQGPGAVLDLAAGERIEVRARVLGPGAERLRLVGPDGVLAEGDPASELRFETSAAQGPTWIAAAASGGRHSGTLDESVFAHTTPVYVDVAGERVARADDARWCLDLLDELERFAGRHGRFEAATRAARFGDLAAVIEAARGFYRGVAESAAARTA
jgi:hypothetical protein